MFHLCKVGVTGAGGRKEPEMTEATRGGSPLREGVLQLLAWARSEERRLVEDASTPAEPADGPTLAALLAGAAARRSLAARMLDDAAAGRPIDGCDDPEAAEPGALDGAFRDAQRAAEDLESSLKTAAEDLLRMNPKPDADHPQYLWRDVWMYATRGPIGDYAQYLLRLSRDDDAVALEGRMREAVSRSGLPAKARSDSAYDLACVLARSGRADEAMRLLPEAFEQNDDEAVPVLKAYAQEDPDLEPLRARADFRELVAV
jgi:hypothetical protein